ncbi:MAG: response regulator transcription factor [Bacteroidales bacterium]|nr:response regulator transcription factor [Bacteroidales bacterium]MBO7567272.1 response regulator transcription factor [Bacteroidales bacterium]MBP5682830.1 response regulator transcription factor [Bacteroidales bacterium]
MIYTAIFNRHKLIMQCIEHYLSSCDDIQIVLTASDKETLVEKMKDRIINVLIVSFYEITHNDIDMIITLRMKYPKTAVLVVAGSQKEDIVSKTIKAGARGFLTIDSEASHLVQAIYTIRGGHDYYSESITHILLQRYISSMNPSSSQSSDQDEFNDESNALSSRQIEILRLWGDGLANQEIADKLFISVRTVETHKNHIMQKLNLKSSVDLMKFAIRNNIISI